MSHFIETVKLVDGKVKNLAFHQNRVNHVQNVHFKERTINLLEVINPTEEQMKGTYKVSIRYSTIIESIQYTPYEIKPIKSLKLVDASSLNYVFKYADRSEIEKLYEQRGDCDDILMTKNGFIAETSYANVALFDGEKWYTPEDPFLKGTKREKLIWEREISPRYIAVSELKDYQKIKLFNAMIDFEEGPEIENVY